MIMMTRLGQLKIFPKLILVILCLLALEPSGFSVTLDDPNEDSVPPFPVVHRIFKTACGRCHQDGHHRGGIQLNTPLQVNRDAAIILQSIESGDMPYMDPTWNKTVQAQTVIRYLKAVIAGEASDNAQIDEALQDQ
jgi:mono/diheme cytochrome c family protein